MWGDLKHEKEPFNAKHHFRLIAGWCFFVFPGRQIFPLSGGGGGGNKKSSLVGDTVGNLGRGSGAEGLEGVG